MLTKKSEWPQGRALEARLVAPNLHEAGL